MSNFAKLMRQAAAGAGSGCPNQYWIALLGDTDGDIAQGVTVDSECNIIAVGLTYSAGAGAADAVITKYNPSGDVLWSRTLGGSGGEGFTAVAVDSEDNIIAVGNTNSVGVAASDGLIVKYNSSGTLQWSRTIAGPANPGFGGNALNAVAVDSSDNIAVTGQMASGSVNVWATAKYNSSGVWQWSRRLGSAGETSTGRGVAIDSSDNIVVTGNSSEDSSGPYDANIVKYNSSGVIQWQMRLGYTGGTVGRAVAIDSSDNIYIGGNTDADTQGGYGVLIAKYNSSGTFQWDKILDSSNTEWAYGIAVDSSDDIILAGYTSPDGTSNYDVLIAKYDSSGALQWDKTLAGTGAEYGRGVATDASDNIIVAGYTNSDGLGGSEMLVAKLPPDGEADGTYGSLVYQDSGLTSGNVSLTNITGAVYESALSTAEQAATLTDAVAGLTEELFEITP